MNVTTMRYFSKLIIFIVALLPAATCAMEFTGRFSMLGATAQAEPGDYGYLSGDDQTLIADQQSVRLMMDAAGEMDGWSVHAKMARQHSQGYPLPPTSASLFRYDDMAENWLDESNGLNATQIGYVFDRAVYTRRFENFNLAVGRQPVDWGSGRFWQPLNIFGAFAPTDLDTDFKPGIDALLLDWYPSAFSSLSTALVAKPRDNDAVEESAGLYYRRQVGEVSEVSLLAGSVLGNTVLGGSFESVTSGIGWLVEGAHYTLKESDEKFIFLVAGINYQFPDGTLIAAEWYDNSRGASSETAMGTMQSDSLVLYGLQQQLGRQVLGLMVDRDITPLLHGSYTLLTAAVNDDRDKLATSMLHQLTLIYSVSNESDLLFSLLMSDGKGMDAFGQASSEYGHLPDAMTIRLRFYF